MKRIKIFDTTLRDGEQSPGCSMNLTEKIEMARQLEKLGVDVIEAGFAAASPGDFESIQAIAHAIKGSTVCSLARANENDIRQAGSNALHTAANNCRCRIRNRTVKYSYLFRLHKPMRNAGNGAIVAEELITDDEYTLRFNAAQCLQRILPEAGCCFHFKYGQCNPSFPALQRMLNASANTQRRSRQKDFGPVMPSPVGPAIVKVV